MKMSSCKQEKMIEVKWDLLDPEIISRQPTINFLISVVMNDLGIWKWEGGQSSCELVGFQNCRMKLLRHDDLNILTPMLITSVPRIQGVLLLIDANESFPQKQTSDFLGALKTVGLNHIIILQTKVDSIKESIAMDRLEAIKKFIKRRIVGGAPVLSVSAKFNIEDVCEYIVKIIPVPQHLVKRPCVSIFRSVDVNKPAPEISETKGVVFCGSLRRVNQMIEIGPGIVDKDENGEIKCTPIYSKIVLGEVQFLPSLFCKIAVGIKMLEERTKLGRGEIVKLNIHSSSIVARVCQASAAGGIVRLKVKSPVCMMQERFAISRNVENQWRLIAIGDIRGGTTVDGKKIYPPHMRRLGWNL
ncbi:hypothetical protein Pint_29033 [Pistacia integerrima]|uniref:Uncharacterized protein n=1 Tax=Pistacia integerrima TaxID=434235 RepID=A0ACC0X5B7_9ROSI|nr:hypothetical protein Pint_29033 [Pistacia integerrima]